MLSSDDLSEDGLLGGRVRLRQPLRGYRAGLDAALLAAALDLSSGERALEAGCGAGGALLQAAARFPKARLTGIERDPAAAVLAGGNIDLNGFGERVVARTGDVAHGPQALGLEGFDAAFANPPFFDDPSALRGPAPERRGAWLADDGLGAWTTFLLAAVKPGGRVTLIHRADRLADLLALLAQGGGGFVVRPVHAFPEAEAKRVLVRAEKGGRSPLRLLPPLILHDASGEPTPQSQAILRGDAALPFSPPAEADARIRIRAYRVRDAEPLAELFQRSVHEAAASAYSQEERRAWAPERIDPGLFHHRRAERAAWVAEIAGKTAGFIDLDPDGHIGMLYVSADHQRQGVASALYRVVEAKVRGQGGARLYTEASRLAQPFFASRGFTQIGEAVVDLRGVRFVNASMEKRL